MGRGGRADKFVEAKTGKQTLSWRMRSFPNGVNRAFPTVEWTATVSHDTGARWHGLRLFALVYTHSVHVSYELCASRCD